METSDSTIIQVELIKSHKAIMKGYDGPRWSDEFKNGAEAVKRGDARSYVELLGELLDQARQQVVRLEMPTATLFD